MDWTVYKAVRAPFTQKVWDLTLEELVTCPRCSAGTWLIPFLAGGAPASALEGVPLRCLPPLDGAVFLCFQKECRTIYVVIFNAAREGEFDALIPYLREAGHRAVGEKKSGGVEEEA